MIDRSENEQVDYDALFDEAEAQMIAENTVDGGEPDYKPDGAAVHQRVLKLAEKRNQ